MDITTRRAGLSADKRALLQQRLAGKGDGAPARQTITRCAGEGPVYPASFMQEQMWLVTQLEPDKAVYNVPVSVLVRADADVPALERAFAEVVRRHEGLRTVFRVIDGTLRQVVMPPHPVRAEVKDVRDQVGDDFERDVRRLVTLEGARFLDVEKGPLVRLSLLRVNEERYALVITVHHIVTDGWAYPLLLHELWTLYAAYRKGETAELPPVTLRYADYAVWQRAHLTGDTLKHHVDYWRDLLAGAPETELLGDRPRPARPSYRGAFHHFMIDERTTASLRALCRREALTLNMVLTAGFAALMARYTGSWDVVVGALFGNRSRPELQEVVGCFVNSCAFRFDLTDDPGLAEASRRARKLILEADEHQELPFEKVVEHLHLERDPSRNPLFQVMFFHHTFIPAHTGAVDDGLDMVPVYEDNRAALVDTGLSKLDLTVATLEDGGRLSGVVEYATDLYDAPTIERFFRHWVTLLGRAAAEPDRPLSQISSLEPDERRTLLEEWSRGAARPVEPATFHRLFEAQAARTPNAEAVRHDGRAVTFAELDARANRLARRLRELGVGPETVVALVLERTPRTVEAMLAVSKAGGAFLPVDPAYPDERRQYMLEDSGARVAVVERATAGALSAGLPRVDLDADADALAALDASPLAGGAEVENAAYVIYTSGSTGRPKGVVVTHRGLASIVEMQREVMGVREGVRVLQFASFSFDASIWDVITAFAGATVVLAPRDEATAGDPLAEFLARERVNVVTLAPSVLAALPHEGLPDLRVVLSMGEAVGPEVVRRWSQGRRFINGYGPTETTIGATLGVNPAAEGRISIGRPFPNLRVYVLDPALRPLPAGAPGEVYVGGVGLARGYLGRPGLTAEKFIPDAFGGEPGARLYRTGDVARWRRDGELEFIGRADRQVKIRGFRIELGEVESALLSRPGVREAAAVAHEQVPGSRRLVAYVAADEGVTADGLRASLRADLPEYMVPSAIILLPALPRTPNGKLDRRGLPAPDLAASAAKGGDDTAPRTHAEDVLARAWGQVLGRERVGIHDNFFELGGDSILSIQVIVRAAREGVRIALRQVFQHQTVADLAAAAETAPVVVAEQGAVTGEAPLTPAQRWLLERELPHPAHWNMAVALESRAPLDPAALEGAAAAVLAHHDALRTRFERGADGWTATVAEPGPAAVHHFDLASVGDAELDAALEAKAAEAHASLGLDGPLFRVARFDLGASRRQRVLVVAHHLVVDAVSLPVLAEDLETAYRQLAAGEEVKLPPKTTAFRDWARRLAEHARSPEMRAESAYWLATLPRAAAPIPADAPGADDTEAGTAAAHAELTAEETRALLEEVPAAYSTHVNDALLAALAEAYRAWSGRDTLLVEMEGHGREDLFDDVDTSRTVGWFTSMSPVHLRAAAGPGETLKGVKEMLRAVPNHGIGYGLLRWLGDAEVVAELNARPGAEVSFNYLGQAPAATVGDDDRLLTPAHGPHGPPRAPSAPRSHRISVEGAVSGGVLRMGFYYGENVYRPETVARLAAAYADALRALIEHCRAGGAGFTPSDFPGAVGLGQDDLDSLLAQLDEV